MIKPLTSLRFFFAFAVFLSHISFVSSKDLIFSKLYNNIFNEGYIGVSFFFILSGFILALNYKTKLIEKKLSLDQFWIARIARIYPMHLITLIIALPLSLHEFLTNTFNWFGKLILNMILLQSFVPLSNIYFSFNSPSWSISSEMFFYLLFPFIIYCLYKYPKLIYINLILILLIPLGIYLTPEKFIHRFFYINPFFRIIDFIIGILLFNFYKREKMDIYINHKSAMTIIEFASIALLVLFFLFHNFIPQGYRYSCYYWIPMVGIIIVFSYQSGYLSAILSNKNLIFLGEISFSFYLIHQLVIKYIVILNNKFFVITNDYAVIFFIFFISLILSSLSYYFIELPCNKYIKGKYKMLRK